MSDMNSFIVIRKATRKFDVTLKELFKSPFMKQTFKRDFPGSFIINSYTSFDDNPNSLFVVSKINFEPTRKEATADLLKKWGKCIVSKVRFIPYSSGIDIELNVLYSYGGNNNE